MTSTLDVNAKEFIFMSDVGVSPTSSTTSSTTSLDVNAKEFITNSTSQFPPMLYHADDLVYEILEKSSPNDYYIKGGKAFHYYYPAYSGFDYVPTTDFDLVATNDFCSGLFEEINKIALGNWIQFEQADPVLVDKITISDESWVDTVRHGKQKSKTKHRVKTLLINDIGFIDVIITEKINKTELYKSECGISYMNQELFRKDLKQVYEDRRQKMMAKGWEKRPELYEKIKQKHDKSLLRYHIAYSL